MKLMVLGLSLIAGCFCGCLSRTKTDTTSQARPGPGVFFVATNGNDAWSGRFAAPNRGADDGPFATLPRALAAAREFKTGQGSKKEFATVVVRGGSHFLDEPIVLKT